MPFGDGTGPDGRGGWCTPLLKSGKISKPLGSLDRSGDNYGSRAVGFGGRGRGFGRGFGAGFGRGAGRFYDYDSPVVAKSSAESSDETKDSSDVDDRISLIKQRLDDLEVELGTLTKNKKGK